jgi:hypothetical protein
MTTAAELDALIEELTVDAYNDEEQLSGDDRRRQRRCHHVDCGPDARTGLTARVSRGGARHEVALADLTLAPRSELGAVVAAYRRWQGR